MDENVDTTVAEITPTPKHRFNVRRAAKAAAITTGVVAGVVLLKRKLSGSVDGEVTATVSTDTTA